MEIENKNERKLAELIEETSEIAAEFLLSDSSKKNFLFSLAKPPVHRQLAHWYLQTFVMMDMLKTLKEIKELVGRDKCQCPSEKKTASKKKGK